MVLQNVQMSTAVVTNHFKYKYLPAADVNPQLADCSIENIFGRFSLDMALGEHADLCIL